MKEVNRIEEKEEYKKIILNMLGEPDTVTASKIGVSNQTIIRWKKELIVEGRTTEAEIQEARRKKKEEAKSQDSNKMQVLELLKQGKNKTEIGADLGIHRHLVKKYEDELVAEGTITREEIEEARTRRKKENKEKVEGGQEITEELKAKVLDYLFLGIDARRIANSLGVSHSTFQETRKILKKEGKITDNQIRESQERRDTEDRIVVLELLFKGYLYPEIAKHIPIGNRLYVRGIVEKLKTEGAITAEQIENAQFERKETERRNHVLDGLRQGLTYDEIAEAYEKKKLTKKMVAKIKEKLVNEGIITEEEIEAAREKRKSAKREENKYVLKPDDEKIRKLSHLGFKVEQIEVIIGRGEFYIVERRKVMEAQGLINRKGLRANVRNREVNAQKRLDRISKMPVFNADLDIYTVQDQIDYEKVMIQLGEVQDKNIGLLRKVIPMDAQLVTPGNVNFISRYLTRSNRGNEALEFMDECIDTINNERDSIVLKLNKGKEEIERYMKKQEERSNLVAQLLNNSNNAKRPAQEDGHEGH